MSEVKITVREEISEVPWAAVCNGKLVDFDIVSICILNRSEYLLMWRMVNCSFPNLLYFKCHRVMGMIFEVEEYSLAEGVA